MAVLADVCDDGHGPSTVMAVLADVCDDGDCLTWLRQGGLVAFCYLACRML